MAPGDTPALRKARGAFFTPEPLAQYVTDWAVRDVADKVLEPSCGEAAFLLSAVRRLGVLRQAASKRTVPHLDGVELHEASAAEARSLLRAAGVDARVTVGDFFTLEPTGSYDAVVGNPPYVRYQEFAGQDRARSREAALRAGVCLTGLASSWAAFTVHAALFLRRGGRMGLVLPAELLTVNYAAEVRRFLMERFARVDLVLFEERVFPEVQEEVVLLLAEGYDEGPTDHCRVFQVQNVEGLAEVVTPRLWKPATPAAKWTASLVLPDVEALLSGSFSHGTAVVPLESWGDVTLGMVTGANDYFALSPEDVVAAGLKPRDLIRISPPGSAHLRGLDLTPSALGHLGRKGAATYLFRPKGKPSPGGLAFIAEGKRRGLHERYKCRVRKEWWRIPLVPPADLFFTYMNADVVRLSANRAAVHHLNSVHGVYLKAECRGLGMDLLPIATLNSLTLLGAETYGRAYGGGMLKMEPKEADRLPVPSPTLLTTARDRLTALRPDIRRLLQTGRLFEAVRLVDHALLVEAAGLSEDQVASLRTSHADLMARRLARGATPEA